MEAFRAKHYDVFISYKREDDAARNVLCAALQNAGFEPWWDAKLGQGDFRDQLRDEINRCDVVVALWSHNAHARPDEVKMEMAHAFGVKKLLPLRLDDAPIPLQFAKENFLPFNGWGDERGAAQLDHIIREVRKLGGRPSSRPEPTVAPSIPVDLGDLPPAPSRLIGRGREMRILREAWTDGRVNAVVLHALGGAGKSALLRAFVNERLAMGGDGASRIYGWSAYSQGSGDQKRADAGSFLARALADFGYKGPPIRDSIESGRMLARLVQRERVLMLLDGLEPLQDPPGVMKGRFKDRGLGVFIKALGAQNPGLLVLTSRQDVPELEGFGDLVIQHPLDELSEEAGSDLLVDLGVTGESGELRHAVRELSGHALSVTLLGTFLTEVFDGDIARRTRFRFGDIILTADEQDNADRTVHYAKRVEKVLQAYLDRFDQLATSPGQVGRPERALLRLLGLFDRPADGAAIDMLLRERISGLTDELFLETTERLGFLGLRKRTVVRELSSQERVTRFREAKGRLRKLRLLASADPNDPHAIDAHPVVRAFFASWLEKCAPDSAAEAHGKLYRYYAALEPNIPIALADMQPLFLAVQHGVKAGCVREAFETIYLRQIYRDYYIAHGLGAYGAMLAVLSNFFEEPWLVPHRALTGDEQVFILTDVSYALRALGRLRESIPPRESAVEIYVANENWRDAGNVEEVLSSTHLILGDVARAIIVARQALEHANKCVDGRRLPSSSVLAGAMACAGDVSAALAMLRQAERKAYPKQLAQFGGYRLGDLLLAEGEAEEALTRGRYHLELATRRATALHGVGLAWLLIGRAEAALGLDEAGKSLDAAVESLRRAGMAHHLPLALLARAAHFRGRAAAGEAGLVDKIRADLEEVEEIAEPEMRLFLTDLALERARVAIDIPSAFDDWPQDASRHMANAARLIAATGYHMRDRELVQLQSRLAAAGSPPA